MTTRLDYVVEPGGTVGGSVAVPGDKSISHRAVMLGALAEGTTTVSGFLEGGDCLATRDAFRAMGVRIEHPAPGRLELRGVGLHGLRPPGRPLDLGNSGTSMRLLAGLLAAQRFDSVLTGDASLSRRPMRRVIEPLRRMGAHIDAGPEGTAPLRITGGRHLHGVDYVMPVASAQVKSALLLAGLYAEGETRVREPGMSRDHTERMLEAFGADLVRDADGVCLRPGRVLAGRQIAVPGDISSAAFLFVAAAIAPGSDLTVRRVGINPTRTGVLDVLREMGADIAVAPATDAGGEPVADIRIRHRPLRGVRIRAEVVPRAIDEFPALFVAAACAEGETRLTGARELRVKESDRIQVMAEGLAALGIDAHPLEDGILIRGGGLGGGVVDSGGDHRVAMAFAVAALRADGPVEVRDCANVGTSFPGFVSLLASCGLRIRTREAAGAPGGEA
ncbi:MAG TPA: 3-phosphoshikimate 1-carboxyvinyltransferase [Gammaproteobacteria bacterium]|nr:3-phosphoshikimate 1-carboxyvinyltransferase [Gammaproteobacteria bacterium]